LITRQNKAGLRFYKNWEIDKAIDAFQDAATKEPDNPEYHLNLARAYARSSDYHQAIGALGDYLSQETNDEVATRYERLFSSALDDVAKQQAMDDARRLVGGESVSASPSGDASGQSPGAGASPSMGAAGQLLEEARRLLDSGSSHLDVASVARVERIIIMMEEALHAGNPTAVADATASLAVALAELRRG